jgi:antitoxin component YwqK of YwqJK toxin-antitoxin module
MKISTSISSRLILFWILLFVFQSFETQAFFQTEVEMEPHSIPFYIGFLLLVFHLPFVLLSFFFAVNGRVYSDRKYADFKTGTAILWTINSLSLSVLIYWEQYVYPGAVLWGVPTLFFIVGILRWKLPLLTWLLSTFYIITVLLLVLGGVRNELGFGPKDGIHTSYYSLESKQIESIEIYDFGRLDGYSEQYYKNGQLKTQLLYHLDTLQGLAEGYYENGQLKVTYQNDKNEIHGLYQFYHKNGKLATKQVFQHGILNGIQETYYPTGNLNSQATYQEGIKEGLCLVYYHNGQIENTCTYEKGVGQYISYYENGRKESKGQLNLDRREGLWQTYYPNDSLQRVGQYELKGPKRSVKSGLWKIYHPNGQLKLVGNYVKGVRKGQWFQYFETGEESDRRDFGE